MELTIGQEYVHCFLDFELVIEDENAETDWEDIIARVTAQKCPTGFTVTDCQFDRISRPAIGRT